MFDATHDDAPQPQSPPDPMIEVAERHLRLLAEVVELAMDAARASSALVVASAQAAADLVRGKDGAWACDMDKARAVHASRDASDAFHRVTRALRLTITLEAATAERLRDLHAGVAVRRDDRAGRQAPRPGAPLDPLREKVRELVADVIAEDDDIDPALDLANDLRERLTEVDRFGPLLNRPLVEVVGLICADIGVTPDWSRWTDDGLPPRGAPQATAWPPPLGQTERAAAADISPGQPPFLAPPVLPP